MRYPDPDEFERLVPCPRERKHPRATPIGDVIALIVIAVLVYLIALLG